MTWVGFELTILMFELAKTFHALDREATVIGHVHVELTETLPVLANGKLKY
jgi:hypothetical protein